MALSQQQAAFARRIGHEFRQPAYLQEALTHPSMTGANRADNQRLEFLGDRVLGLAISEALLEADPAASEGQLAPRFNALVRKETCADVARQCDLGKVLNLGRSEMMSGGRRRDASLGDALEAVIAAVYLDAGFDAARALVRRLWADRISEVDTDARDAKSALQEYAQADGQPPPRYIVEDRSGPAHAPEFTISVVLQSGERAQARAGSKRQAEQSAARELLDKLGAKGTAHGK